VQKIFFGKKSQKICYRSCHMHIKFIARRTQTSTAITVFWKPKLELWIGFVVTAR